MISERPLSHDWFIVWHDVHCAGEQPEQQSERDKTAEFSIPTWMVGHHDDDDEEDEDDDIWYRYPPGW